ncbi:MAG TPA: deoxyribonuclease IV [Spirochaetota bacterium]|nr:deoxyribonuclease IV [Spirochaetota bacterium]
MKKRLGFHLSAAGGVFNAIDEAAELGINALQIFTKNSNRWTAPPLKGSDIALFKEKWSAIDDLSITSHTGYLINLAGDGENLEKSILLMKDEILRAHLLGIKYLVLHPGNHKEKGIEAGIKSIAENLDQIFSEDETEVVVLLETTAGQGSSVGHRFEHIRDIIAASKYHSRLGVCLDTCHIFAAGYDISTPEGYLSTMDEFNRTIGFDRLKLFHFNDSKKGTGSKVDRHEHIGLGIIGSTGLSLLLNDERFDHIDYIMETPVDDLRNDRDNLQTVLSMLK